MGEDLMTHQRIARLAKLLASIERALGGGPPLSWGQGERITYTQMLEDAGIELVTETSAKRQGHAIKRGARAVAVGYFGRPIQIHADLFVLGLQTRRIGGEKPKTIQWTSERGYARALAGDPEVDGTWELRAYGDGRWEILNPRTTTMAWATGHSATFAVAQGDAAYAYRKYIARANRRARELPEERSHASAQED